MIERTVAARVTCLFSFPVPPDRYTPQISTKTGPDYYMKYYDENQYRRSIMNTFDELPKPQDSKMKQTRVLNLFTTTKLP